MSDETARLKLAQLVSLQELNAVTWNEALAELDVLVDLYLLGQFVNTPPSSPSDGDAYLIGGAPTGAWTGYSYKIAAGLDGAWRFYTPFNGLRAFVAPSGAFVVYLNGVWTAIGSTDFATKSGSETLTNKTLDATLLPGGGSIGANGKLGIGKSSPEYAIESAASVREGFGVGYTGSMASAQGAGISAYCTSVPSAPGQRLGFYVFGAGSASLSGRMNAVAMCGYADEAWTMTSMCGGYFTIETTANGTASRSERLRVASSGNVGIGTNSPNAKLDVGGDIFPHTDNSYNLGSASYRFGTVYAATGAINTSGMSTKSDIRALSEAEIAVAKTLAAKVRIFRFADAVASKGAVARLHTGMIAEDVFAAFAAAGLDPFVYGVCCRDPATKAVATSRTIVLENGDEATETCDVQEPDCDAQGRQKYTLGLRYAELTQFVLAGLAARLAALEAK